MSPDSIESRFAALVERVEGHDRRLKHVERVAEQVIALGVQLPAMAEDISEIRKRLDDDANGQTATRTTKLLVAGSIITAFMTSIAAVLQAVLA